MATPPTIINRYLKNLGAVGAYRVNRLKKGISVYAALRKLGEDGHYSDCVQLSPEDETEIQRLVIAENPQFTAVKFSRPNPNSASTCKFDCILDSAKQVSDKMRAAAERICSLLPFETVIKPVGQTLDICMKGNYSGRASKNPRIFGINKKGFLTYSYYDYDKENNRPIAGTLKVDTDQIQSFEDLPQPIQDFVSRLILTGNDMPFKESRAIRAAVRSILRETV